MFFMLQNLYSTLFNIRDNCTHCEEYAVKLHNITEIALLHSQQETEGSETEKLHIHLGAPI
jgi:hypothetical protein